MPDEPNLPTFRKCMDDRRKLLKVAIEAAVWIESPGDEDQREKLLRRLRVAITEAEIPF